MATTADLITAARRHLYGAGRNTLNRLAQDVALDDVSIVVGFDLGALTAGSVISVGLEDMYVWAVNGSALTVEVQRGWQGSVQSTHQSNDIVAINPRFTDFDILTALNDDLQDLSSPVNGLYQIRTETITAVSGRVGYDFPFTDFLSIGDVRWQIPNSETQDWQQIWDYEVGRGMPISEFPSGQALFIRGPQATAQQPILIRYRAALGQLGNLTDSVLDTTGLADTAADIPPMGAAIRVMAGRPIGRAQYDSQGDTRRATEVTTADVGSAPNALRQLRQTRIAAEATRLAQAWPAQLRARV